MANEPYVKKLAVLINLQFSIYLFLHVIPQKQTREPYNENQLAKELSLDYKAIVHHFRVLEKNNIITKIGEKYNVTFFISNFLEVNMESFDEIQQKLEQK